MQPERVPPQSGPLTPWSRVAVAFGDNDTSKLSATTADSWRPLPDRIKESGGNKRQIGDPQWLRRVGSVSCADIVAGEPQHKPQTICISADHLAFSRRKPQTRVWGTPLDTHPSKHDSPRYHRLRRRCDAKQLSQSQRNQPRGESQAFIIAVLSWFPGVSGKFA